ncbi:hypothetical protein [Vibrio sp. PID23_8]|uniref:hypothetical protein n=1 Tax=Vibrio sp. PID23_8 TaxID=1583767 RepID=UPI000E6970B7|nr:hypothetical protein [Vibrio sp. PID23_8]RIZ50141.1 hypothetical protein AK966_18950 [Vibrio sp. PID23_8]
MIEVNFKYKNDSGLFTIELEELSGVCSTESELETVLDTCLLNEAILKKAIEYVQLPIDTAFDDSELTSESARIGFSQLFYKYQKSGTLYCINS